ncbi:SGNH/GDSL hydrolase family protein [Poriferisphaera sp. WC338]|uniref:SGNH/GDSL hydrolase family protein n=1 Tax=Poriferisphaera sp. WC338 TaxID=3425129 RepID=UPI003D814E10
MVYRIGFRAVVFAIACGISGVLCAQSGPSGPSGPAPVVYSRIISFGDSLSDVGNTSGKTRSSIFIPDFPKDNYDVNGGHKRFSDGHVWVEQLAVLLKNNGRLSNSTVKRSTRGDGGFNYSWGGARSGPGKNSRAGIFGISLFDIPNVGSQIDQYISDKNPTTSAASKALYTIWAGGNNYLEGQTNTTNRVNEIASHITTLANKGAKHFVIPNLPQFGKIPRFRPGQADEAKRIEMNNRSKDHNNKLAAKLEQLRNSLGINIFEIDIESLFDDIFDKPSDFGLANVKSQAKNVDQSIRHTYLFFDDIHPTSGGGHRLMAEAALAELVPEPTTALLLLSASVFGLARRRRLAA